MKAIIIDDERSAIDVLRLALEKYCPEVQVLATCQGGAEGIEAIKALEPDIVFLDIEMPNVNGFDVLNATQQLDFKVVFTTAYDQFAIKAFKFSAFDYLLKPIDLEELMSTVAKLKKEQYALNSKKLEQLYLHLNAQMGGGQKIGLPVGDAYEFIPYADIIRCESDSNYTYVFLVDKRKLTLSKTLKDVEDAIRHPDFFRIHHSHLINLTHIKKFYKHEGGYVVMDDGQVVNISRAKKTEFVELMKRV
jgi:two-component system LytT family response regulator